MKGVLGVMSLPENKRGLIVVYVYLCTSKCSIFKFLVLLDVCVALALEVFKFLFAIRDRLVGNVVLLVPTAKVLEEPKSCCLRAVAAAFHFSPI